MKTIFEVCQRWSQKKLTESQEEILLKYKEIRKKLVGPCTQKYLKK